MLKGGNSKLKPGKKKGFQKSFQNLMSPKPVKRNLLMNTDHMLPTLSPGRSIRPQTSIILSQLDPTQNSPQQTIHKKSVVPSNTQLFML